ncbi:MAG: hypothetical protein IJO70_10460 [Lachnospiraceae bacterium]|nr:hypothetical protein [Lachnospiraceae bacterium]
MKKLLCIASLMLMVFLVGCKEEKKLDIADLQYDWQFVEMEAAGVVTPHTSGLESKEPAVKFDGSTVEFSLNGKSHTGTVKSGAESYDITYSDGSKAQVAKLSNDGNTLTISIENLGIYYKFNK